MVFPWFAGIFVVLALVLANAFFVAAEFALVSSRSSRIDQLAESGDFRAKLVQRAQRDPNLFISAAQLGITVASLLLGWLGEDTFARLIEPPLLAVFPGEVAGVGAHAVASILAIVGITFLHITLGEQVPKMVALQRAESVILFAAPPTDFLARVFKPFIALLYAFTNLVLRSIHIQYRAEEHAVHSPEELQLLVRQSANAGKLSTVERELVERAFAFSDLTAGEVMVPRTELVGLPVDASAQEALRLALRHRHSRFPVYDGTIDNVVGVLSAKDLLAVVARRGLTPRAATAATPGQTAPEMNIRRLMRQPIIVPQGAEVSEVLARMKAARQPLAVVLDEFGGTAGIVTLRDLVARLLGEMGDEYAAAAQEIRHLADGTLVADGLALVEDVNSQLGTHFDASEVDTLGGLVFSRLGRRPRMGDEVAIGAGYGARVERLDGLRVARVRLIPRGAGTRAVAVAVADADPAARDGENSATRAH